MRIPDPVVIDCESDEIFRRPAYPPAVVGVSFWWPGKKPYYRAFGHLSGNNASKADVKREIAAAYRHPDGVLFHHGKFDVDAIEGAFGLKPPPEDKVEDSMFLAFLDDPNQKDLGLKSLGVRMLGRPHDERDELAEWFVRTQPVPGVRVSDKPRSKNSFMRFLKHAPGDVAAAYANGDVERTRGVYRKLRKSIADRGMTEAYRREQRLVPVLLRMERAGLAADVEALERDVAAYRVAHDRVDAYLMKRLKSNSINLNSGDDVVDALIRTGLAREEDFLITKTGKLSSSKDSLSEALTDPTLAAVFAYRSKLDTFVGTFMESWLETARASGGLVYTNWNQTKSNDGGQSKGARTGRLSGEYFMNTPKNPEPLFRAHADPSKVGPKEMKAIPTLPRELVGLPPPPSVRRYIKPRHEKHVIGDRDYVQQELRILAHFEYGPLMAQYVADPWIDFHNNAMANLERVFNRKYERGAVKNINFGLIYGQGVASLAVKNRSSVQETADVKKAILQMYPGIKRMYDDMRERARAREPFRTWGGRVYHCEEPVIGPGGRIHVLDYKMVNTLIQGSAADSTKEAMIRYDAAAPDDHLMLISVHDQLAASFPERDLERGMRVMKEAMESIEFDVPMFTEGKIGRRSWGELEAYDKKGKVVWKR